MEAFRVDNVEVAMKLAIIGLVAGVMFYAIEKYVLTPAEAALQSVTSTPAASSTPVAA